MADEVDPHTITPQNNPNPNNIINVSSHTLTNSEIKLLNKGLSFIPKPHVINHVGLLRDFDQLVRKGWGRQTGQGGTVQNIKNSYTYNFYY